MNYNLQGKTWEGASDLLEVNWRLGNPHSQEGHPERAGLHVCRPFPVGFFKDADSHVAPPSDLGTAVGAGDNAPIGRMGRDGESIAATLAAPERESVRVRLDRLRHDTASILVSRTTTGEEWLNGASLFLKRPLSSNFPCGSCLTVRLEPLLASCWGFERLDLCR